MRMAAQAGSKHWDSEREVMELNIARAGAESA